MKVSSKYRGFLITVTYRKLLKQEPSLRRCRTRRCQPLPNVERRLFREESLHPSRCGAALSPMWLAQLFCLGHDDSSVPSFLQFKSQPACFQNQSGPLQFSTTMKRKIFHSNSLPFQLMSVERGSLLSQIVLIFCCLSTDLILRTACRENLQRANLQLRPLQD